MFLVFCSRSDCFCCYWKTCLACINNHQLVLVGVLIELIAEVLFGVALLHDEWAVLVPEVKEVLNQKITLSITGECRAGLDSDNTNSSKTSDHCKILFGELYIHDKDYYTQDVQEQFLVIANFFSTSCNPITLLYTHFSSC